MNQAYIIVIIGILIVTIGCNQPKKTTSLPYLGQSEMANGDKVNHKIPDFEFMDQDSNIVNNASLSDFIYVTDFFFMHCPSICPKVMKQMLRLYDKYHMNPHIKFVSHTLDPKRDTPPLLKQYAKNLGVEHSKWLFLHGSKEKIFDINDAYFVVAFEDADAPEGIEHSGKIILVDKDGHVRGFAEGTDPEDVTDFMADVDYLLSTYE